MTLKIGSRSPKSNQLVLPSKQCICASLVKIRPWVQKLRGPRRRRDPHQKQYVPPFGWGDIINLFRLVQKDKRIIPAITCKIDYFSQVFEEGIEMDVDPE